MLRKSLLMAVSAGAVVVGMGQIASAQVSSLNSGGFTTDESVRTRSETAELYASTIAYLMQVIERDIAGDSGATVISAMRGGHLTRLPSLDDKTLQLIDALKVDARVIDANPDPAVQDERIVVFVRDGDLRQGITRADIEAEARRNGHDEIIRIQNGSIVGRDGSIDLPEEMSGGVPAAGIGAYIGVSGNDKVTSGERGSAQTRVLNCPAGEFGTGIVQRRQLSRATDLGGTETDNFSGWVEISRSCAPEYSERVRYFDTCTTSGGRPGQALFEATQYVRKSGSNPFETEIFIDKTSAIRVEDAECLSGDRVHGAQNFLVNGRTQGARELQLKTATTIGDIGNGVGSVPREVNPASGAVEPVDGIPFLASALSDFQFTRSCRAEYGSVAVPWSYRGSGFFTGDTDYYRDYNRRETYFSDNTEEYILNYELVTDPNAFGWASKGRGTIDTSNGAAPGGDGWYKYTETCERALTHDEVQYRTLSCSGRYPSYPNGTFRDRRDGIGHYTQTTADNPAANGPTLNWIDWDPWYEVSNSCYYLTESRSTESRVTTTRSGNRRCSQRQERTRVVTTRHYYTGGTSSTTTYDPNWTNDGGPYSCQQEDDGSEDKDGDGVDDGSDRDDNDSGVGGGW